MAWTASSGGAGSSKPLSAWAVMDHAVTDPTDTAASPTRLSGWVGQPARHWCHTDASAPAVITTPISAAGQASHASSDDMSRGPSRTAVSPPSTAITAATVRSTRAGARVASWRLPSATTAAPTNTIGGITASTERWRRMLLGRAAMWSRPKPSM